MPFLFRRVRRGRWLSKPSDFHWLANNDAHADPVTDLRTQKNKLSVFKVDGDMQHVERIAIALAATGENTDFVDYLLFDEHLIAFTGIRTEPSEGETPDGLVNGLHLNLVELSAAKLGILARAILEQVVPNRIQEPKVKVLLEKYIDDGTLDTSRMQATLLEKLGHTI